MARGCLIALAAFCFCAQAASFSAAQAPSSFLQGRIPRWLPRPEIPADNPLSDARVALGRSLFYDTRLSGNQTYACASCHKQALAFTDGLPRAVGSTGETHPRSAMSLTNVAYNAVFGWNDRRTTLEAQMDVPMYNEQPIELGLRGQETTVLSRFHKAEDEAAFRAAFPSETASLTMQNVVKAIASFERVLISGNSPFDRYLYADDRSAMSPAALRGVGLFFSDRLKCSACHSSFNLSGPTRYAGAKPPELVFHDTGLPSNDGAFRAPTLRNIAVTAPYMHDGSIRTLAEVVRHYASGGTPRPAHSPLVGGFQLSSSETDDLVAFLESLTDRDFLTNPAFSNPHIK